MDVRICRVARLDSTRIARDVDEACDRFEAAWRAGNRPLIEDFFGGTTHSERLVLLRHPPWSLSSFDYRRRPSAESPGPSEYRRRFPGLEELIDSVFAEFARRFSVVRGGDLEPLVTTGWDGPSSGSGTSAPRDVIPSIPGYEIRSELGRGGMGVVYKARQIRLNRLCALKMLLLGEHTGAESRVRFLAEAETIAKLRHPNVVQIYGLGDHNGRPYFEMEYIEGGSLANRLDGTPWAPGPAARMVAVLARAIGDAHRLGIVHRDLKPANVLLVDADTPKIVDFGLAKTLEADSNLTQSGVFVGTPSYAAPEQVEGLTGTIGPAADIYALGAIFYHMLTGRPPFQAATVLRTLEQVKNADPVPPSRLQPGLSQDAETICLEVPGEGPAAGVTPMPRPAGGSGPLLGRASDPGPANRGRGALAEVEPAPAGGGPAFRSGGGGHRPGLHPGLLAMAPRGSQGRRGSRRQREGATGAPCRFRESGPAHVPPGAGSV